MAEAKNGTVAQRCVTLLSALDGHLTDIVERGGLEHLNSCSSAELSCRADFEELQREVVDAARAAAELDATLLEAGAAGRNLLQGVPPHLVDLYEAFSRKERAYLRRLADLCRPGISLADFLTVEDYAEERSETREIGATLDAAVFYWDYTIEADDDRRIERFDFERTERLIAAPWFQPDAWVRNERDLAPALVGERPFRCRDPLLSDLIKPSSLTSLVRISLALR
jgi:hypothetical protein